MLGTESSLNHPRMKSHRKEKVTTNSPKPAFQSKLFLSTCEHRRSFLKVNQVHMKWRFSVPCEHMMIITANNDGEFLCHRSARNKKPGRKQSVIVFVKFSILPLQLIILTPHTPIYSRLFPKSYWQGSIVVPLSADIESHASRWKIQHSWWQVALKWACLLT